jgi:hypothetical protein
LDLCLYVKKERNLRFIVVSNILRERERERKNLDLYFLVEHRERERERLQGYVNCSIVATGR